jgi:hypothetical protein
VVFFSLVDLLAVRSGLAGVPVQSRRTGSIVVIFHSFKLDIPGTLGAENGEAMERLWEGPLNDMKVLGSLPGIEIRYILCSGAKVLMASESLSNSFNSSTKRTAHL